MTAQQFGPYRNEQSHCTRDDSGRCSGHSKPAPLMRSHCKQAGRATIPLGESRALIPAEQLELLRFRLKLHVVRMTLGEGRHGPPRSVAPDLSTCVQAGYIAYIGQSQGFVKPTI